MEIVQVESRRKLITKSENSQRDYEHETESTSEISEIFWNNVMISLAKIQKM